MVVLNLEQRFVQMYITHLRVLTTRASQFPNRTTDLEKLACGGNLHMLQYFQYFSKGLYKGCYNTNANI